MSDETGTDCDGRNARLGCFREHMGLNWDAALLGWAGTVPFACRQRVVGDGWVSR
jgi:hypothetical protein